MSVPVMILRPRTLALLLALLLTALLACACSAGAQVPTSPWWHLTSGTRPTYLKVGAGLPSQPEKPGVPGVDEVQEVTLQEQGAILVGPNVTAHEIEQEEFYEEEKCARKCVKLTTESTEVEAQEAFEGLEGYGAGNVKVKRIDETHYTVTFVGALAEQPVTLIQVGYPPNGSGVGRVTELTKGVLPVAPIPATEALDGELSVTATNVGDANVAGESAPVQFKDVIPQGLHAVQAAGTRSSTSGDFKERAPIPCVLSESAGTQVATCTFSESLVPYDQIDMRINVKLKAGAHTGEQNEVTIAGGAAPSTALKRPITVSEAPVPYGVEDYEMALEEEGGAPTVQAGAHPFQLTTTIAVNQLNDINPLGDQALDYRPEVTTPALAKDLAFKLPPGLIGNATTTPQCTTAQFFETVAGQENRCPADTAVGVATATVREPATIGTITVTEPVFNLEPRAGEPARFGFYVVIANSPVSIDTSVRNGSDYGVTVSVNNITQTASFLSSEVTFWGVPGDPRHDYQRGWGCIYQERGAASKQPCVPAEEQHPKPFLSLPTSCTKALSTSVQGNSWESPDSFFEVTGAFEPASSLDGCNRLSFNPQLKLKAETEQASKPSAMTIDVHVPQETNESSTGLASSNIRDITVAFPQGVSLNPESADGLEACAEGQVGFLGGRGDAGELLFSPDLPQAFCPDQAKLGTVKIKTPLLSQPLEGALYLASSAPNGEGGQNPFNSLLATYIVAKDPVSGVLLKLPGSISLDPNSGRLTTTFENNPDLNFEDAEINLFSGPRAPLQTPTHCGTYTTTASFTPWSGTGVVNSSSSFNITSGPEGSPCPPETLPFTPTLTAGTSSPKAGAFANVSLALQRANGQQRLVQAAGTGPQGLAAIIANVTPCPEPQAAQGTCPASSQIGHAVVTAGEGSQTLTLPQPGAPEFPIYLTGPYEGAPFGASVVTPIIAGPLNLGTIVTRAKIGVDPRTAQVTLATDPLPQIIKGVPTDIRSATAILDRQNFTFNPTNCSEAGFTGSALGAPPPGEAWSGTTAPIASRFQVGSCGELAFTPKVAVATAAKASKKNGASLSFKIAYPTGAMGKQAWFNEAKFVIPKQLPARLTTIQKACVAKTFETDRAACPAASKIGTAIVHTQVLPVPLEGPVYFVSYGSAKFPDAVMVLHGDNVNIELDGETLIRNGVTSATFRSTPDVPFESIEVNLPTGPFSEFGSDLPGEKYDFCGQKLSMPYALKAQNGLEVKQSAAVTVSGCSKKIALSSHRLKGRTLTLTVYAPAAGKLKVSGKGLPTVTKSAKGQELLTISIKSKRAKRFKAKLKLSFTPSKGARQAMSASVRG